jgi:hypothetical protein
VANGDQRATWAIRKFITHRRLLIALGIGVLAGLATAVVQGADQGFIDLWLAHGSARYLLAGRNPYDYPTGGWPSNPLTTVLVLVPLAWLDLRVASPIVFGIITALLVYAMTADGQWWRLWTLASFPFVFSMIVVQWSPLMLAILFWPALYAAVLIKPNIGAAVALMHFTPRRALVCLVLFLATFLVRFDWLSSWLGQLGNYDGFIPLRVLPGPLILFALLRRRLPQARFLLLYSLVPQRLWYDQLLLWWIPQSRGALLFVTACSWFLGAIFFATRLGYLPEAYRSAPEWVLLSVYIPMLVVLFWDAAHSAPARAGVAGR